MALPVNSGGLRAPLAASAAQVVLAAFHNPVEQLLDTLEVTQNYLFGAYYSGGDVPTAGAGEANWPYAGLDQTGGDVLNYLFYNEPGLGYYNFVGLLPNSIANAGPIVQALQINLFDYINAGLTGLNSAAVALSAGVWNYPSALLSAAQLALQGQFAQALSVLGDAVFGPITAAGQALLSAGTYVLGSVVAHIGAVVAALPQIFTTFAGTSIGGAAVLAEKSASIAAAWVSRLAAFDFEGAWNVAVDGLLGPSGLPGLSLNLTTGAGVQTGPIVNPDTDIPTNFVPSWRTSYQAAIWSIADALSTPPVQAGAAVAPVASARVARPASAAALSARAESSPAADESVSAPAESASAPAESGPASKSAASGRNTAHRDRAPRAGTDRSGN